MKWRGEIELTKDSKLIGEIDYKDGIYKTRVYKKYDDGSISQNTIDIGWAKSLSWAKRKLNQDTEYSAKDWNWKRIE